MSRSHTLKYYSTEQRTEEKKEHGMQCLIVTFKEKQIFFAPNVFGIRISYHSFQL